MSVHTDELTDNVLFKLMFTQDLFFLICHMNIPLSSLSSVLMAIFLDE
jgi:hypothetical protein